MEWARPGQPWKMDGGQSWLGGLAVGLTWWWDGAGADPSIHPRRRRTKPQQIPARAPKLLEPEKQGKPQPASTDLERALGRRATALTSRLLPHLRPHTRTCIERAQRDGGETSHLLARR